MGRYKLLFFFSNIVGNHAPSQLSALYSVHCETDCQQNGNRMQHSRDIARVNNGNIAVILCCNCHASIQEVPKYIQILNVTFEVIYNVFTEHGESNHLQCQSHITNLALALPRTISVIFSVIIFPLRFSPVLPTAQLISFPPPTSPVNG